MFTGLPSRGSIKEYDLAQILMGLHEDRITGVLHLEREEFRKSLYLKEGNIVYASSNDVQDRLGEVLMRSGRINREQFERANRLLGPKEKRFGAVLVEEGFITPKELFEGLKDQVKEIIYDIFFWDDGRFQVVMQGLPADAISLHLDMADLVSEILKRIEHA